MNTTTTSPRAVRVRSSEPTIRWEEITPAREETVPAELENFEPERVIPWSNVGLDQQTPQNPSGGEAEDQGWHTSWKRLLVDGSIIVGMSLTVLLALSVIFPDTFLDIFGLLSGGQR